MISIVVALAGGNILLGLASLFQYISSKKKVVAESDAIFVDTAKEIILLLKTESKDKDDRIAKLENEVRMLREEIHKFRSKYEVD